MKNDKATAKSPLKTWMQYTRSRYIYGCFKDEIGKAGEGLQGQGWNMPYLKYMKHKQQQYLIHDLTHRGRYKKEEILQTII